MGLKEAVYREFRDIVGDVFQQPGCPLTGYSLWRSSCVRVPYSPNNNITMSARVLEEFDETTIAETALRLGKEQDATSQYLTVEQIKEMIPDKCKFISP